MCLPVSVSSELRCDLQVVNSSTAANNLAIVLKQLRTAKCPNWEDLADMFEQLSLHRVIYNLFCLTVVLNQYEPYEPEPTSS